MLDTRGRAVLKDIGDPRMARKCMFWFQWSCDHFKYSTNQFITMVRGLNDVDRASFKKMSNFVQSFSPVQNLDRAWRPLVDADGESELEPCYISCKELAKCESADEAMILLGTNFVFIVFRKCTPV